MKVINNFTCSNFLFSYEAHNTNRLSVPKNQTLNDTFVKSNSLPQVSFGKNVTQEVLNELNSNKSLHQIHIGYNKLEKFLTGFLGLTDEGYSGSHHKFSKEGLKRPLELSGHGKEARWEDIRDVRKLMKTILA